MEANSRIMRQLRLEKLNETTGNTLFSRLPPPEYAFVEDAKPNFSQLQLEVLRDDDADRESFAKQ